MSIRKKCADRQSRFERLEDRVVLSAQSVIDLMIDVAPEDQIDVSFEQIAPAVSDAHFATGIDYVREQYGLTGRDQTVAVIDTGIAWDHYALGGGYGSEYRVVGGWDFAENDANPYDDGPAGYHGTHVAGIIGSSDSQHQGVAHEADLVALRVFDDMGRATFGWVEQALQWVHEHRNDFENPITTVNLSIGTEWNENTVPNWAMLEDEFAQLNDDGIFVAVAAGNSFQNYHSQGLSYPAVSPHVVPVASVGHDGELSDFSQRNSRVVAAPGESIESTIPNHLYGDSRPSHRFLALSGTSMATPYLAGASVLVREAMDFSGYDLIDQDLLYQHFRATADEIWDNSTQSQYFRLNLRQALDAILTDQVGDEAATAHHLGVLDDRYALDGTLESVGDRDYFSFVAAASGQVSIEATSESDSTIQVGLDSANSSVPSSKRMMDVIAGQRYTFAIESPDGLAHYDVELTLVSEDITPPTELGVVADRSVQVKTLNGVHEFAFTTHRKGTLTALADAGAAGSSIRLQLLNDQSQIVADTGAQHAASRIDFHAAKGEQLILRVVGSADEVDLRLVNLIDLSGERVDAVGTSGSNHFQVAFGQSVHLNVDGVDYEFDRDGYEALRIRAGLGEDSLELSGTSANEHFRVRSSSVSAESEGLRFAAHHLESSSIHAGDGHDRFTVIDTEMDEAVVVRDGTISYSARQVTHQVSGIEDARIRGGQGTDTAILHATMGDDRFVGTGKRSSLHAENFVVHVKDYDRVQVIAPESGFHRAVLIGEQTADHFDANRDAARMTNASGSVLVEGFDRVVMDGQAGSNSLNVDLAEDAVQVKQTRSTTRFAGADFQYVVRNGIDIEFAQSASSSSLSQPPLDVQTVAPESIDMGRSMGMHDRDRIQNTVDGRTVTRETFGAYRSRFAAGGQSNDMEYAQPSMTFSTVDAAQRTQSQNHDAVFDQLGSHAHDTSSYVSNEVSNDRESSSAIGATHAVDVSSGDSHDLESVEVISQTLEDSRHELNNLDSIFEKLSNEVVKNQTDTHRT